MSFTNPIVENPYPYAYAITANSANTLYEAVESLVPGIYTITFTGGGTLNVDFYNGTTYIGTATSSSSPFLYNLGTQATNFKFWCSTTSNIVIALTALALSETNGTLYTYTTSQTINLTGDGYVILVGGGGGGGGSGQSSSSGGGGGGGSGGITGGRIVLTGSQSLTIGSGGSGGSQTFAGSNGGNTTLGSFTANGGGGGNPGTNTTAGSGGIAGTPNGGAGGAGSTTTSATSGNLSVNTNSIFSFFTEGTTGGGGGGSIGTSSGSGAGSGVGTGGNGGIGNQVGAPGTGYGSGGGGGGVQQAPTNPNAGGNGQPGVCYLIV